MGLEDKLDRDQELSTKLDDLREFLYDLTSFHNHIYGEYEDLRILKTFAASLSVVSSALVKDLKDLHLGIDLDGDSDQNQPLCYYKSAFGKESYKQLDTLVNAVFRRVREIESRDNEQEYRNKLLDEESASPFKKAGSFRTRTTEEDIVELRSQREGSKITPEAIERLKEELAANRNR